jgi:scyllo-inositol 2-dehydrogenase (NADP+)
MAKVRPVRLGIVGIGRAGWGMQCKELQGREKKFQIVAACDTIRARREKMADAYGCATYAKVADLVADKNVQMVSIATRSCDHLEHTLLALKAGKHVFLEKPMCVTVDGARKIRAAAAGSKGKLYIRQNRRFEAGFQHIREIIDSGILGDVFEIKLRRGGYQRRNDWQTLKRYGGGQLLNWGPHVVDHALQFLGSPVKNIWSDLKRIAAVGDTEDHVHIILTGRNGRVVDLQITGGGAIGEPTYLVLGSRGALRSSGKQIELKYLDPRKKLAAAKADPGTPADGAGFGNAEKLKWIEKTIPIRPKDKVNTETIWDELFDAVRKRKKFRVSTDEAVEVMRVLTAARKGTKFQVRSKN